MRHKEEIISGRDFQRMIAAAYRAFMREHEQINRLNVFPVPDGDTGTNMLMTLAAVAKVAAEAPEGTGIGALSKLAADSAIMGARGNSGVILSQIFRGIARGLAGKEEAVSAEIGKAFEYGVLYAYRAVARPVEGTILTVAKGIAKGAQRAMRERRPFADILSEAVRAGKKELARTPELLPVLKTAGVVDAGGQGLIVFLQGCLDGLQGTYSGPEAGFDKSLTLAGHAGEVTIVHPYCTEFIIKNCSVTCAEVKKQLVSLGESLVLAEGDGLLKIHIHTAHPGKVLEWAVAWGTLHDIKIDNMADQHRSAGTPVREKTGLAVISVVSGEGLTRIMQEMGADVVLSGGQTMNPPVEDFVSAVHKGHAEQYIILPNNRNIVLAANQARKLLGDRVAVVPTSSVPQGLAALLVYDPNTALAENVRKMSERTAAVRSASITIAVRDSVVNGHPVAAGTYIGMDDNRIVADAADLESVLLQTVKAMVRIESEIVSLYYGDKLKEAEAARLAQKLAEEVPDLAIETYYGGQPLYQFVISVE
ncbi:Hypothetical protein LUCI_1175 [Lucifera butyrica]|uniref:DhaL domain-containing protein n=1 Tax=Lucifera butyrica TaxID=1351585 RepID=A0A498R3I3_9FIRM|nr:DAK2 domain-containing protein [Lucifera butyrica]VBB05964.1 Hypothetical protein LUCI_1175 [Lucifera butyrica]